MVTTHFKCTTSDKLNSIPIDPGLVTFVSDTRTLYLDTSGVRTPYTSIITLASESQRQAMVNPLDGFYYVLETQVLWHYDKTDGWVLLSGGSQQIKFDELPEVGSGNRLYVYGIEPYRWTGSEYTSLVGTPVWKQLS